MDFYSIYGLKNGFEEQVPSLSLFMECYSKGDYLGAIGLDSNAYMEDIISAIDAFEFEHWEQSDEWTIPLQNIKQAILESPENAYKPSTLNIPQISTNLDEIQNLLWQALEMEKNHQYPDALKIINQVIEIAPMAECYDYKGDIYRDRGEYYGGTEDFLKAIKLYEKAININPEYTRPYTGMALAYVDLGGLENLEKAQYCYQIALSHDPNSLILYLDKMELEICMGEYDRVIGTYGELLPLISSKSDEIIANYLISLALALKGRNYEKYADKLQECMKDGYRWSTLPIENYLNKLEKESGNDVMVTNALKIHKWFKKHVN